MRCNNSSLTLNIKILLLDTFGLMDQKGCSFNTLVKIIHSYSKSFMLLCVGVSGQCHVTGCFLTARI